MAWVIRMTLRTPWQSDAVADKDRTMQKVVFDEPYEFIPPYRGRFWSWFVDKFLPKLMRSKYGVQEWNVTGSEHLQASLAAGHGVILCPNHCRPSDPLMSGFVSRESNCHLYAMASWHVFKQSKLEAFIVRRVGAFSVYREGMDRKALDTAVEIVRTAERPLVIFAEGVISGANDRLMPLMDGVSFIARAAAKRRAKDNPDAKVVVHPLAFKYHHTGDPEELLSPILSRLEQQLFWRTHEDEDLYQRVVRLREGMQAVREVQFLGSTRSGVLEKRIANLVEEILSRYEREWLKRNRTGDPITRVKDLRIAILIDMVDNKVDDRERARRWRHLTDLYYAQCMSLHVEGYLNPSCSRYNHRLFEIVERLEEELTDKVTIHQDLKVDIRIGAALTVDPKARKVNGETPLMSNLRENMLNLLEIEDLWPPQPVIDLTSEQPESNAQQPA